jgi:large subunit ribosomal protein L21
MEAIVEIAGFQYRVKEDSVLKVPKLEGKVGDKFKFPNVLMLISDKKNVVGTPYVKGASLEAEVLGFGRYPKIIVFKYKPKKRYKKKRGHRQDYTEIKVTKIQGG